MKHIHDPEQSSCCVQAGGQNIDIAKGTLIVWMRPEPEKSATGPIETAQSARGGHPKRVGCVLRKGPNPMSMQAIWIIGSMTTMNKRISISIMPVELPQCSYPQNASSVHKKCPNRIACKASFVLAVVPVDLEGVPIVTIPPPGPCAKPLESLLILGDGPNVAVRESVRDGKMTEAWFLGATPCREETAQH